MFLLSLARIISDMMQNYSIFFLMLCSLFWEMSKSIQAEDLKKAQFIWLFSCQVLPEGNGHFPLLLHGSASPVWGFSYPAATHVHYHSLLQRVRSHSWVICPAQLCSTKFEAFHCKHLQKWMSQIINLWLRTPKALSFREWKNNHLKDSSAALWNQK